ncbi:cell division protein ZapA [Zoogloea sp.]|uniref:cell division protein ZapA n=1 Tax=Zoogloea sp. TaxID=49181 RepID=UPI0035B3B44A|nr:cell division protein ZapA [Rhodocyclales bacterium]
MEQLDIKLQGREYRVACKPEDKADLLMAVNYLDEKMRDLASRTNSAGERLAVMVALNVTHEFLQSKREMGFDIGAVKRRIEVMGNRLDDAISDEKPLVFGSL